MLKKLQGKQGNMLKISCKETCSKSCKVSKETCLSQGMITYLVWLSQACYIVCLSQGLHTWYSYSKILLHVLGMSVPKAYYMAWRSQFKGLRPELLTSAFPLDSHVYTTILVFITMEYLCSLHFHGSWVRHISCCVQKNLAQSQNRRSINI